MERTPGKARYSTDEHNIFIDFEKRNERRLFHLDPVDEEDRANLQHVVLTWNNHQPLLDALRDVTQRLDSIDRLLRHKDSSDELPSVKRARELIIKATA